MAASASIFVTDPTQVILDIDGYFVPANDAEALVFYPGRAPCRVVDSPAMPLAGSAARISAERQPVAIFPSG